VRTWEGEAPAQRPFGASVGIRHSAEKGQGTRMWASAPICTALHKAGAQRRRRRGSAQLGRGEGSAGHGHPRAKGRMISATCSFCRVDISPWRPPPRALAPTINLTSAVSKPFLWGTAARPMKDGALFDDHADSAPGTTAHPKRRAPPVVMNRPAGGAGIEDADGELRPRLDELVACFTAAFNRQPSFALRVPGRVNLIGEHVQIPSRNTRSAPVNCMPTRGPRVRRLTTAATRCSPWRSPATSSSSG
jgi:hypothetical protein